jgi:alpha-tubulin suppressor-like RCC1 family protein
MEVVMGTKSLRGLVAAMLVMSGTTVLGSGQGAAAEGVVLSIGDQSGLERDEVTGSAFVPVYLSAPASEPVVVSYWTVDGTALASVDYIRWGSPAAPRTTTIPVGEVQTQINVPVLPDSEVELDEEFSLVATASGGGVSVGDGTGMVTIVDSDSVSAANPGITVSNPTVVEGDSGERRAQFLVHLSRAASTSISLSYATADGTAAAGSDYTAKPVSSLVLAAGQISKSIDVAVPSNVIVDGSRSFTLVVAVTGGSPVEEMNMIGAATIEDDDVPPPTTSTTTTSTTTTSTTTTSTTTTVPPPSWTATGVTSGTYYHCALTAAGGVKCWGWNGFGMLGDGTTINRPVPVDVVGLSSGVRSVSGGNNTTCALMLAGSVKCWGNGWWGALGTGNETDSVVPVQVVGLSGVSKLSYGDENGCVLTQAGGVKCWGHNDRGQVGNGTFVNQLQPVDVVGLTSGVLDIAVDSRHACALLSTGGVKCWGYNASGAVGDSSTQHRNQPVAVSGLSSGVSKIFTGQDRSCAILATGAIKCWGDNSNGALGDGTTTNRLVPVDIAALSAGSVTSLASGSNYSCALTTGGGVKCWGGQVGSGNLGNNSTVNSLVPVEVVGISEGAIAISADTGPCALLASGSIKCWGVNSGPYGRLGNGTTGSNSLVPVNVVQQ